MEEKKPDLLMPLVRAGWVFAVLGPLLPASVIVQIVHDHGPDRFRGWLIAELLLSVPVYISGRLLIRKSPAALPCASFLSGFMLISAAGYLHWHNIVHILREESLWNLLQGFVYLPNLLLQILQLPFLIYFARIAIRPRWHEGLLAGWSDLKTGGCRIACGTGIGFGVLFQILWRLAEHRITYK
ncbi:MAG TPA: hypothetical protein VM222_00795 [Planctomycetota bacterium]|nr:hypothetical protein [Planctomycetota bacterium]